MKKKLPITKNKDVVVSWVYIVYTPDDMNIAGTLIGGVTNSNPSYFMPASRTVEKYGLELY